jgi:hypothetical protein
MWEIWNEPNVQTFWGKHGQGHNSEQYADEYLALVKACVPAMRQADPDCIILGGSVSNLWSESFKWEDFCFKKGILDTGIDAWSVHPYSTKNPEDHIAGYATVRAAMANIAHKPNFPLLNTERGFPVNKKAEGFSGGDEKELFEYQAWYVVRQYLIDQLCHVNLTIWYEWGGKEGFALVKGDAKNPAYNSLKTMIDQLTGYTFDKRIDLPSDRDFALQFKNKDGGVKLVVWTAPPVKGTPNLTVNHDVDIPTDAAGTLDTVQIYGDKGTIDVKDGQIAIQLTGAPQYLVLHAGK